jgi:hypothetical protein
MTATITGFRDPQYLVDYQDGTGSIYDADEDWLWPPRSVATLAAQGYWVDPGTLPPTVEQMLTDLNTARAVLVEAPSHHDRCQVRPVEQHLRHVLARSAAHGAAEQRASCHR